MGKAGRKRIEGARYESGRLLPPERRDGPAPGIMARQIVIERQAADAKWGSKLGLLYLEELVTAPEMRTGFAYGAFRARFDAAMGMPRRTTEAMCYGESRKATPRDLDDDEVAKLRERHAGLLALVGGARPLLDLVCCEDRQPAVGDILRLRVALRRVQPWFGVPDIEATA